MKVQMKKGLKKTDKELNVINLINKVFKGNWNCKISPRM